MITPVFKGSYHSKLMIIGEYLGAQEVSRKQPLVGYSGDEFYRMAQDAGLTIGEAFTTNILHQIPKYGKIENHFFKKREADALGLDKINGRYPDTDVRAGRDWVLAQIDRIKPHLILLLGNTALWAVAGREGITKWRGSVFEHNGYKMLPLNNPAAVLKNWPLRFSMVQDLRRARNEMLSPVVRLPPFHFHIRPTADAVLAFLESIKGKRVTIDIETRKGQISCIGIGVSRFEAMCIPFMCLERSEGYWSKEEELLITIALRDTLTDPSVGCVTQGGTYDCQYIAKQWGFFPNVVGDTMVAQRVLYPSLPKSLDFMASLYCEHYCYWKDEGREWNPKTTPEDDYWVYNAKDCAATFEVFETQLRALEAYKLTEQFKFEMRKFKPSIKMSLLGVRANLEYKNRLIGILLKDIKERMDWLEQVLGHPINPKSSPQMIALFYTDFKIKPIINRTTQKPTVDDDALEVIIRREPLLRPLIECIQEIRSLGIFTSNYAMMELDPDNRIRCTFHFIPETFRFSSSKSPWNTGANLQTIPKGSEED